MEALRTLGIHCVTDQPDKQQKFHPFRMTYINIFLYIIKISLLRTNYKITVFVS